MMRKFLVPVFFLVLVGCFFSGCNNTLIQNKQASLSVALSFEAGYSNSRSTATSEHSTTWKVKSWLEKRDTTTSHHQEQEVTADEETSLVFSELKIGEEIRIRVELTDASGGENKYTGTSEWVQVTTGVKVVVLVLSPMINKDAPLGSQFNPVTSWAQLQDIIGDTSKSNPDTISVYASGTLVATDKITVVQDIEIISVNNLSIERNSGFTTGYLFESASSLTFTGTESNPIIFDGNSVESSSAMIHTSDTLNMTWCTLQNNINTNTSTSPSTLFIYSGTTTLNNVTFSGNQGDLDGAADIYLYQHTSSVPVLKIGKNFSATEIYFNAAMSSGSYPEIHLDVNTSVSGVSVPVITVGSATPEGIKVITNNGYTGEFKSLFTVEGTNGINYTLDENGAVVSLNLSYNSTLDTLTIYTEEGLKNFRSIVNGDVSESAPITVGDKSFTVQDRSVNAILANSISITEENWTPIGNNSTYPYCGTFDGGNHSVTGITVDSDDNNPHGFFGSLGTNAVVKNLTVEGTVSSNYYAGGITGYIYGATIENCVNKIDVTSTSTNGTGGIAGYVSSTQSTITGCVNFGTIKANTYVGGIVGASYYNSTNGATVNKCINLGSITATDANNSGYASGIYGYAAVKNDSITNCLNMGSITSTYGGAGITTNNHNDNNTVQYCLNVGNMSGVESTSNRYAIASKSSATYSTCYYDSDNVQNIHAQGSIGKKTTELQVDTPWNTAWTTENWSYATGRYPIPNIQANIPADIWDEIVTRATN